MGINFSKYVRQGKKTFSFGGLSGGAYGANISYKYGYFSGNKFEGLSFSYDKHTVFERDDDEKDGIGSMTAVRESSIWLGTFVDGKKNGYCRVMEGTNDRRAVSGYYAMGRAVTAEEAEALSIENKHLSIKEFSFSNWQTMPVDPIDKDGFSVLREMDYFRDGDLRYTVTEGEFVGGELNGFGTEYHDSNVNGYHKYMRKSGVFKKGKLFFGYSSAFENTGGKQPPEHFGYADRREINAYGEEIVYEGKKYIGEALNGVPCGIGCLFEDEDKMLVGTFKDGELHGIGCTYRLLEGEWVPYDYLNERKDRYYSHKSWGIYAYGEFKPDMTWEEFFDTYCDLKKV